MHSTILLIIAPLTVGCRGRWHPSAGMRAACVDKPAIENKEPYHTRRCLPLGSREYSLLPQNWRRWHVWKLLSAEDFVPTMTRCAVLCLQRGILKPIVRPKHFGSQPSPERS